MYKLPKDFDPLLIKGCQLQMICFAQYSLYLHFDLGILITIEGKFFHIIEGRETRFDFPISDSRLTRLLAQKVIQVESERDMTLKLVFSNGDILVICGDSEHYEDYHIKIGDRTITV
jgi:hypothetical protein